MVLPDVLKSKDWMFMRKLARLKIRTERITNKEPEGKRLPWKEKTAAGAKLRKVPGIPAKAGGRETGCVPYPDAGGLIG